MDGGDLGLGQAGTEAIGAGRPAGGQPAGQGGDALAHPGRRLAGGRDQGDARRWGLGQQQGEEGGNGRGLAGARAADDHRQQAAGAGLGCGPLRSGRTERGEQGLMVGLGSRPRRPRRDHRHRRPAQQLGGDAVLVDPVALEVEEGAVEDEGPAHGAGGGELGTGLEHGDQGGRGQGGAPGLDVGRPRQGVEGGGGLGVGVALDLGGHRLAHRGQVEADVAQARRPRRQSGSQHDGALVAAEPGGGSRAQAGQPGQGRGQVHVGRTEHPGLTPRRQHREGVARLVGGHGRGMELDDRGDRCHQPGAEGQVDVVVRMETDLGLPRRDHGRLRCRRRVRRRLGPRHRHRLGLGLGRGRGVEQRALARRLGAGPAHAARPVARSRSSSRMAAVGGRHHTMPGVAEPAGPTRPGCMPRRKR